MQPNLEAFADLLAACENAKELLAMLCYANNWATATDGELAAASLDELNAAITRAKGEAQLRKIDLCDEILALNVDGYVGESTAREVAYAERIGRPVRWLEAAAPDLFKALEYAFAKMPSNDPQWQRCIDEAAAALHKAQGGAA